MQDLLKYVVCIYNKPVRMACLTDSCQLSPFVCSQNCLCYGQHKSECQIKSIDELTQNMFLVMYSPILKGSSIEVMGRYAEQTKPKKKNQQFALTFDPINLQGKELNEITFRLKSIKACVGVGIFISQILIKNSFKYIPDNSYMNHGAYMLLSNNYLFSSSIEEENCVQSKSIQLNQNSLVKVKVIRIQNKYRIEFTQQGSLKRQYLTLDWQRQKSYHFGVYLYDVGDIVEIVNKRI